MCFPLRQCRPSEEVQTEVTACDLADRMGIGDEAPPQVQAPQQPQGEEYEELVGAWRVPDGVDEELMEFVEWIKQCSKHLGHETVRAIGTEFSPDPRGWMMRKRIDIGVRNLRQLVPGEATEDNEE